MNDYPYRVAMQINIYPMDFRHAEHLLEHQIRIWGPMVDRIVITVDTHRSRSGRYRGRQYLEYQAALRKLLSEFAASHPQIETIEVDYSPAARREVGQAFFGVDDVPAKAWDGGPFYAYFFGLLHSRARYIMHFDSDIIFGGLSTRWIDEAIALFDAHPDALLLAPLAGPPRDDGALFGHGDPYEMLPPVAGAPAYRFQGASTRIFMIDMKRLRERIGNLPLMRPTPKQRTKSRLLGNSPEVVEAEVLLARAMTAHGMYRIDFLGSPPGMWSVHPPYRGEAFYRGLPQLVLDMESGAVPDSQRGAYEVNDDMVDWSIPRAQSRRHRRILRMLGDRLSIGG